MRLRSGLAAACALAAFLAAGCSRNPGIVFQGYIEGEYVYIAPPVGGTLTNLAVARGSHVKTGQLLFILDRSPQAAELRAAEKNLAQARANLALAQAEYVRRVNLRAVQRVISAEELDRARADRDAAAARAGSMQANLDKARWSWEQKAQYAPANAFVQDTLYRPGEWVPAGSPVVVLLPPANIKVRFFVPEPWLARLHAGEVVAVTFDGMPHPCSATIHYISSEAEFTPPVLYNRQNRANLIYMMEGSFSAADAPQLRPGQPVDVAVNSP
ncbi:MAG: efflux RND transporter periplasmic adaptor subunit [Verrucomicrobia bacterium]|nr:efflux RND transporter periplasmic adaptor subunit [Verrucomicrobiota bacterium]MDE3099080.1 efflux RND transporter periplasmic adaptor subunit [Verrucomicrobiota bacterium]